MKALVLVLALALSGCALAADGIYKLGGPNTEGGYRGGGHGVGDPERWREIEVHPRTGLQCREVERPRVRAPAITTRAKHPNGYKALMQVFTAVEVVSVGLVAGISERRCASDDGCSVSRTKLYASLAPFVVDLLYGTYRSFTIHHEIVRTSEIRWGHAAATPALDQHDHCAPGTEIPLHAGGEVLVVHVGDDGVTLAAELELIARFVAKYPAFAVAGANVKLDASQARALVAHVLPPTPVVAASRSAPPAAVPPPAGAATIDVQTPLGDACIEVGIGKQPAGGCPR